MKAKIFTVGAIGLLSIVGFSIVFAQNLTRPNLLKCKSTWTPIFEANANNVGEGDDLDLNMVRGRVIDLLSAIETGCDISVYYFYSESGLPGYPTVARQNKVDCAKTTSRYENALNSPSFDCFSTTSHTGVPPPADERISIEQDPNSLKAHLQFRYPDGRTASALPPEAENIVLKIFAKK